MKGESIRAFSDPQYDYYRLTKDIGLLKAGDIFYHDPDDHIYGSVAQGCLKNCWTPDGNCRDICGGTVIFHYDFVNSDLFEKTDGSIEDLIKSLSVGRYELTVESNGRYVIRRCGRTIE